MRIWKAEGLNEGHKFEDDVNAIRYPHPGPKPFRYDYDRETLIARIRPLGVPWHSPESKGDAEFVDVCTWIGFLWDYPRKRVSLPETKRFKFLRRVEAMLDGISNRRFSLNETDKIHGSLCHISFVYFDGRDRLSSFSNFAMTFEGDDYLRRYPPPSFVTDLKWWKAKLSLPEVFRPLIPLPPPASFNIYVDASTDWGVGILIDNQRAAWRLLPGWKGPSRDICWLESIAIELVAYVFEATNAQNLHLLIHSDNQGAIGAFRKGRSSNFEINLSIRRTFSALLPRNIFPTLKYVESAKNPADPISRGLWEQSLKRLATTFTLPPELQSYLVYV